MVTYSNNIPEVVINAISNVSNSLYRKKLSVQDRIDATLNALASVGIDAEYEGEKPNSGSSFHARIMSNGIRVNVRCGYGRNNYAPCIMVKF